MCVCVYFCVVLCCWIIQFCLTLGSWNYSCCKIVLLTNSVVFFILWGLLLFVSNRSVVISLVVGLLQLYCFFTPVFLHSFLLHKTIFFAYYFLVVFHFHLFAVLLLNTLTLFTFTYTLLVVTSHILLIILYLT